MDILTRNDLPEALQGGELFDVWLDGLNAKAARLAPCLSSNPTAGQMAEARLILSGIIKRWSEAGSGAIATQTAGPFSQTVDNRERAGYRWWPSEITDLQAICSSGGQSKAFAIDTMPSYGSSAHLPWCSSQMGASYCSCGVDIAGEPIFEGGAL